MYPRLWGFGSLTTVSSYIGEIHKLPHGQMYLYAILSFFSTQLVMANHQVFVNILNIHYYILINRSLTHISYFKFFIKIKKKSCFVVAPLLCTVSCILKSLFFVSIFLLLT